MPSRSVSVLCACASVVLVLLGLSAPVSCYYRGAAPSHTCVDIPRNLSLCDGIGYEKMRLPNLLDHDTVVEVTQQAVSWVPLQNVHCHADTQLFLCSLFSPVCLDHPIYPCRSLCERVRRGCEGRMRTYGFPWPEMFHCDKFPVDNDMCIASRAAPESSGVLGSGTPWADGRQQLQVFSRRLHPPKPSPTPAGSTCKVCNQAETYENILDNFCTADFVIRTRFKRVQKSKLNCKKIKILKKTKPGVVGRKLRRPVLILDPPSLCCEEKIKNFSQENFLVMGHVRGGGRDLVPSFLMRWIAKSSKVFKQAIRMFKSLNCSDPKFISHSVIGDMLHLGDLSAVANPVFSQKDIQFPFSSSPSLPSK